jgi:hypothetical protein
MSCLQGGASPASNRHGACAFISENNNWAIRLRFCGDTLAKSKIII